MGDVKRKIDVIDKSVKVSSHMHDSYPALRINSISLPS